MKKSSLETGLRPVTVTIIAFGFLFYSAAVFAGDSVETYPGDQADVVSLTGTAGTAAGEIHEALLKSGAVEGGGCGAFFVQSKSVEGRRNSFNDSRSVDFTVDHASSKFSIIQNEQGKVVTLDGQSAQDLFEVLLAAGFSSRYTCAGVQIVTGQFVVCRSVREYSYDCSIRLDN